MLTTHYILEHVNRIRYAISQTIANALVPL